jgi:hypothetical protein
MPHPTPTISDSVAVTRYEAKLAHAKTVLGPTFSSEPPTQPGLYQVAMMENEFDPHCVAVSGTAKHLLVHDHNLGALPLKTYNDSLTDVLWKKLA